MLLGRYSKATCSAGTARHLLGSKRTSTGSGASIRASMTLVEQTTTYTTT
jgi:hypothetical protein